ncbi:MAG: bifunctional [glutamate--ammonia ligase]-adenylyl-L-tyrosine phosphorylase/[glutamate--ammonia-ligase] adenylyltransferase [Thermodesulfobacteriota bacterium]
MDASALKTHAETKLPNLHGFLASLPRAGSDELAGHILETPNPVSTAGRLDDLLAADPERTRHILAAADLREPFLATVGGSRFLASALCRNPALMDLLFTERGCLIRRELSHMRDELRSRISRVATTAELDRILRTYKEEQYLRIGCRDLAGMAGIQEAMGELSDLAVACIQAALEFHWNLLAARHGTPPGSGGSLGFVVLGLGKISGRELNFSSDVDLMFLRSHESGYTDGPTSMPVTAFYEALARSTVQSLSKNTEDGFVFRVDLRLRPEGEKGELVPSVSNALEYYWSWGRTWERAAMMKAVPLAGDEALGKTFLKGMEPFLYRKHLDYSTLEEMRSMKRAIAAQLQRKPGINIKLGQGGIREIEFFVQAFQLINGGRTPKVRSPGTMKALALLEETGMLDADTCNTLREAYCFFRKTEHRIQINHQLQTHELPRTTEEQCELARRMGYRHEPLREMTAELERHRRQVGEIFASLLGQSGEDTLERISPRARSIVESIHDEEQATRALSDAGFENPGSSRPVLKSLLFPPANRMPSERSRRLLEALAPLLVDALLEAPQPDDALLALDSYIDSLLAPSAYFTTLLENPPTIKFLIRTLSESGFFTDLLVRHPQSFDSLIGKGREEPLREQDELKHALAERMAYCADLEARLDVLRIFKNEEMLRIGVHHLSGGFDSTTARWLMSELAEVCLDAAVEIALKEMGQKFGFFDWFDEVPFVILGMGKLGGQEMTYMSDLDVIFIYDSPSETIGSLSAHEWFARLGSRVISVLKVPTAEGVAFDIDTRLRPSGNQGPLVSSLASFEEYHRTTSKLWEKQALVRARPVTGPTTLRLEVERIIRECLVRTALTRDDLAEISRLRERMECELGNEDQVTVDLKNGHGGLVDVEFVAQALILTHCREFPEILCRNTLEALAALRHAGLIDAEWFAALDSGYRFLTNMEDRLRIMEQRSVNRIALTGEKLRSLARRLGYADRGEEALIRDYFRVTESIRRIYEAFFTHSPSCDIP